jgi:plasmid stabilization system protein ParE
VVRPSCDHACVTDQATEPLARAPQTLADIATLVGDRGHHDNPRRWERLVEQWRDDRRVLAETEEGRALIVSQMVDVRPAVRLWSAAAVLFWDEDAARPVLSEIRDSPSTYDLHSITAKHTLREYAAGTLDRDGRLPGT